MAHPLQGRFVLDTSLFLSEDIRRADESLDTALDRLLSLLAEARLELHISTYMPPSTYEELVGMLERRGVDEDLLSRLNTWVITKNPDRFEVMVPAEVVYRLVEEMAERVDAGLRVSEDAVRSLDDADPSDDERLTAADRVVSQLRDDYREALRGGVLDSREDFDLLILARELDAGVVTEDQGIREWAADLGLRYTRGRDFPDLLDDYLQASVGDRYPE
jgi:hypothetical protein